MSLISARHYNVGLERESRKYAIKGGRFTEMATGVTYSIGLRNNKLQPCFVNSRLLEYGARFAA